MDVPYHGRPHDVTRGRHGTIGTLLSVEVTLRQCNDPRGLHNNDDGDDNDDGDGYIEVIQIILHIILSAVILLF